MPAATRPPPWQCGHHRAGVPRARNPWCAPRSTPVDGTRGDRVCADCSPRGLSPGGQTRAAPSNPCRTTPASSASGAGITAPGADRGDGATWGSRAGRSDEGSGATPKDRDSRQPRKRLERAVPSQESGRFETPEPQDNRIQEGQQHLGNGVGVIALREPHPVVEALSQPQAVKEAMQQKHATIPRQVVPGECDADVLGTTTMAQLSPLKCAKIAALIT